MIYEIVEYMDNQDVFILEKYIIMKSVLLEVVEI